MSYASDNCRDGFRVVTRQCEYTIKIYIVLIFPLVALLHRSLARSVCERTFTLVSPSSDLYFALLLVSLNFAQCGIRAESEKIAQRATRELPLISCA